MSNVLVFIEQRDGKIRKASFEALTLGREVAAKTGGALGAVVAGSGIAGLAPELAAYGAAKVFVADKPELALYSCEGYTAALDAAVTAFSPAVVLVPGTSMGKDVAPRLAARRKVGLLSDVMSLEVEGGRLVATRLVYSGKARATVTADPGATTGEKAAVRWTKLELPPARQAVKLIPADDPAKAADELVRLLRDEAKVL